MKRIFENDLFRIEHDADSKLVITRRQPRSLAQAMTDENLNQVLAVLRPLRGQRLLADLRAAVGNNSPAMEAKAQVLRRHLSELFAVRATLVNTAVGRLQVMRMARERGEPSHPVFLDEAEAIAYLRTQAV